MSQYSTVETLLSIWGRWAVRAASGALGYPSTSPMFRDAPRGDSFGPQIPMGIADGGVAPEIYLLDAEVARLPVVLKVTIVEVYQRGGSRREIALRMGVKTDAVKGWLDKAHSLLSYAIVDRSQKGGQNMRQLDSVDSSVYQ